MIPPPGEDDGLEKGMVKKEDAHGSDFGSCKRNEWL
jgi:hypothetical protein